MTDEQAKETLLAYRPWTDDAQDPEVAEALEVARQRPELQRWLKEHCERQEALRAKFREISVPEGLREQILSERRVEFTPARPMRRILVGALACLVIIGALASILYQLLPAPSTEDLTFSGYRQRMVKTALRAYGMDLETNSLTAVRSFLAERQCIADFTLPPALEATETIGCGILQWQGNPVTMVCFRTSETIDPALKSDLLLFVIAEENVKDKLREAEKIVAEVSEMQTVSWREGGKIYLLAGFNQAVLRQRL